MRKRLLFVCLLLFGYRFLPAQDSLFYFPFWTPKHQYQKARVRQEGVFLHVYKDGALRDSVLLNVFLYDSLGQVVQQQDYRGNRLRTRFTHYYTGHRLDSTVQDEPWLPGRLLHKYAYDSAGNLCLRQIFRQGKKTIQYRYAYNRERQPLQGFVQVANGEEHLSVQYDYRPDRLLRQIHYFFDGADRKDNFSCIYAYDKDRRAATKLFQRTGNDRRYIEWKKTFNEGAQLVEKISPPLPGNAWLPPYLHGRSEEEVETSVYLPNGLVSERQVRMDDKLLRVEKHVYF